jgi:hypothetical protein
LSRRISLQAINTFGETISQLFHSKKDKLSSCSSSDIFKSFDSIFFIIQTFSKISKTLAKASKLEKSVILTICSILFQVASKQ